MDVVFAKANEEKVSPVKMAQIMPHFEGYELEHELARYFGDGSKADGSPTDPEKGHRKDSVSSSDNNANGDSEKVAVSNDA